MNDEYFNKLVKRAKQRAKLVISRPDFQKDVLEIRKRFDIPPQGLVDNDSAEKWHHEFYQSDDIYFEAVWLKKRNEILRLKKQKKFREADELNKQINNEAPINAFRIRIKIMLQKYKLPLQWEQSIRRYILFNDENNLMLHAGISIKTERDDDTGLNELYLQIEDDTTLEDVKQIWGMVKYHQKTLHSHIKDKFQPIKQMDRDMRAFELYEQNMKLKEVANILSSEFGETYEWNDVSKFIERHRKKLGINQA